MKKCGIFLLFFSIVVQAETPKTVVTPDWGIAATMGGMKLDPLATGDMHSYPLWVDEPKLAQTINWGARYFPNRELLAGLNYDLVFDLPFYFHLRPLYQGKPVYHIAFKGEDDFATAHWDSYAAATIKIGELMNGKAQAEKFVQESERALLQWGKEILQHPSHPKSYAVVQFSDSRNFRIYAENSLFHATLEKMGLQMATLGKGGQWGNIPMKLADLAKLPQDTCLLIIAPFSPISEAELNRSYLWKRMGFKDQRCVHKLPPVWVFGGMDSVLRFGRFLHQAIMTTEKGKNDE